MFTFLSFPSGKMCMIYLTRWQGTFTWMSTNVCVCVCVQFCACRMCLERMQDAERKHVVYFRARGLSASFFILSFLVHISLVVHPLKVGHLPPVTTPPPTLQLDVSPLSVPSLHSIFSVLNWKGERMLSPHKSQSLLVLQEQGSCHREALASLTQKAE